MQQRKNRPHSRGGLASDIARRSVSGASTASHDSFAQDYGYETERRYAPIRPNSQPTPVLQEPQYQSRMSSPEQSIETAQYHQHQGLEHVHQFNHSHTHSMDPQMHGEYNQHAFGATDGGFQNGYKSASEAPPDLSLYGRKTNNSTPQPGQGTDVEKKDRKGGGPTAANEKELRELLEKNEHRNLDAIAKEVRNAERTQKSERAKQLFAMRWLREFCKHDKESVPRNRVYTHYAQRCGTDRVDTLNPASFGKLVRIIFPGIQTRRLGVRGESKYHYVNLTLREDPQALLARPPSAHNSTGPADQSTIFDHENDFNSLSRLPAESAAFPAEEPVFDHTMHSAQIPDTNPQSKGYLFADPYSINFRHDETGPQMFSQTLRFSSSIEGNQQDEPLTLPNIQPYIPPKTDMDLADALTALYRTHCTSLIDSVRYVKEKQFFRLLGSFNGTLTVPVSKLFSHQNLAPWIKMCDMLMYQQIIRFVSQLALQVIPPQVFTMLGNVSNQLTYNLRKNFSQYPEHVLQAKLEPATIFASLLQRLLRVNETAHAAANLLTNDQVRNMMWQDWVRAVNPKRAIESELPQCGHEEVYGILTHDIRQLLEPLEPSDWYENGTQFQADALSSVRGFSGNLTGTINSSAEGILDRWALFLKSLPSRFPQAPTRTLLHCVSGVATAVLRDITVSQAQSFGSWWITKVWVDEMMLWLAEMGGFLGTQPEINPDSPQHSENYTSFVDTTNKNHGNHGKSVEDDQSAGLGIDFQQMPHFAPIHGGKSNYTGSSTTSFKFPNKMSTKDTLGFDLDDDTHDDSGIGMSLLSNDVGSSLHDFTTSHEATVGNVLVN